jgi:deoxyribonuclease-4
MKHQSLILGAHMSASGGLEQALIRAQALGCTAVQFFSKSNRQWHAKPLTENEIALFRNTYEQSSLLSCTIHACYLINIGSPVSAVAEQSRNALAQEYSRAVALGVDHLVFHPGAYIQGNETACLEQIATHINSILNGTSGETKLVLETMAGQGSTVCYNFEQLAYIMQRVEQKERIGVCLDTCHIFAAGYDIAEHYHDVIQQFEAIIGLSYLSVIHLNDSKKELGSRVDRHEHIGKGKIGLAAFRNLMQDKRLTHVSKILETPKDTESDDLLNLTILRGLLVQE